MFIFDAVRHKGVEMSDKTKKQDEYCEGPQGCQIKEWLVTSDKCKECAEEHNSYHAEHWPNPHM